MKSKQPELKKLNIIDRDTPIENYPGYLVAFEAGSNSFFGVCESAAIARLKPVCDSDWLSEVICEISDAGSLQVDTCRGTKYLDVGFSYEFAKILAQLPSLEVFLDNGDPDWGPAAGAFYVVCKRDSFSKSDIDNDLTGLLSALLPLLQKKHTEAL